MRVECGQEVCPEGKFEKILAEKGRLNLSGRQSWMPGRMKGPGGGGGECDFMMALLWICHLLQLCLVVWMHVGRRQPWVDLVFKFHLGQRWKNGLGM